MICLYYFDMLLLLVECYNGFIDCWVMDVFICYGQKMIVCYGDKVKYWFIFNEQNLYYLLEVFLIFGYLQGEKILCELYLIQYYVMMVYVYLIYYLYQMKLQCQMGGMLVYVLVYMVICKLCDIFCVQQLDEFLNQNLLCVYVGEGYSLEVMYFVVVEGFDDIYCLEDFVLMVMVRVDYLVFSYYVSCILNSDVILLGMVVNNYMLFGNQDNLFLKVMEWNWQIDLLGFWMIIICYYNDWCLLVFLIENGIGVIEFWDGEYFIVDDYCIVYYCDYINVMKVVIFEDGVQVIGYFGWGLIDILSLQGDMCKCYGVVYVNCENYDFKDLWWVLKKSYVWLKQVFCSNGEVM